MNESTLSFPTESELRICELVDNECPLSVSDEFTTVLFFYVLLVMWGVPAIIRVNRKWKTIRATAFMFTCYLLNTIPSMIAAGLYIYLQGVDRDYKEMFAALLAVLLALADFYRNAWGLYQVYRYWRWVKFCLNHLIQHGYSLDDLEKDLMKGRSLVHEPKGHLPYEVRLLNLSQLMYVNNSIIDTELQDLDVPFDVNTSVLFEPQKWIGSEEPLFTPTDFAKSSLRYMIPFLAQFGGKWLEDCDQAKTFLQRGTEEPERDFLMTNAIKHAEMLTTGGPHQTEEDRMAANWANTWSTILMYQETSSEFRFRNRVPMPFGGGQDSFLVGKTFGKYESWIQTLVDGLPFMLSEDGEKAKQIQHISAFHLESFVLFLGLELDQKFVSHPPHRRWPSRMFSKVTEFYRWCTRMVSSDGTTSNTDTPHSSSSSKETEGDLDSSFANSTSSSVQETGPVAILEGEPSGHASGRESKTHSNMIGNNEETRSHPVDSGSYADHEDTPVRSETGFGFDTWSFGRTLREKLPNNTIFPDFHRLVLRKYSEPKMVEFTIHLENIFALGVAPNERFCSATNDEDWNCYYGELSAGGRRLCKAMADEDVIPRCALQREYWKLWKLPKRLPPGLGDLSLAAFGTRGSIKFIGYIMETVRVCLAKWSEQHVADDMDTAIWSPEMKTDEAVLEFEASKALCRVVSDGYGCLSYDSDKLVFAERVIWECQNHVLGLTGNNMRLYGPFDVELMLMCMLGFPVLNANVEDWYDIRNECDAAVSLMYAGCLMIRITLSKFEEEHVKIRMMIIPDGERNTSFCSHRSPVPCQEESESFAFEWAKWIHRFEAGMKVLRYEYSEGDLCPIATSSPARNSGVEGNSSSEDVLAMDENDNYIGDSSEGNAQIGDGGAPDTVVNEDRGTEMGVGSSAGESAERDSDKLCGQGEDEDGEGVSAGCCCDGKYRLNTKARRVFIKDRDGVEKCYWEWEGWKPQPAFEKCRFPLVHDVRPPAEGTREQRCSASNEGAEASVREREGAPLSLRRFLRRCAEGGCSNRSRAAGDEAV